MAGMRLGVASSGSLAEAARNIEAAGFRGAWAYDSVGRGHLLPEPLIALAIAATVTRDLELGTGVLQVPLRDPVNLARQVLTTHLVSGGRLRLGVGAGSTAADFAAVGVDFASRFRRPTTPSGPCARCGRVGAWGRPSSACPGPAPPAGPDLRRIVGRVAVDRAGGARVRRLDRIGRAVDVAAAGRGHHALP